MLNKTELRKYYKQLRQEISSDKRKELEHIISGKVLSMEEYIKCSDLLIYVSGEIEVGTHEIIKNSFDKKRVLCPRCIKGTNLMDFCHVKDFQELECGSYGISEPSAGCAEITEFDKNSVCIIPGLSFDLKGYRLGFGKGYYDRFLADFNGIRIGLCYENCLTDKLPSDSFDISSDYIVTERRIIKVRKG